jgi:hypothetical protein
MRKLATLHELQTVYGSEDAYDMFEITWESITNASV